MVDSFGRARPRRAAWRWAGGPRRRDLTARAACPPATSPQIGRVRAWAADSEAGHPGPVAPPIHLPGRPRSSEAPCYFDGYAMASARAGSPARTAGNDTLEIVRSTAVVEMAVVSEVAVVALASDSCLGKPGQAAGDLPGTAARSHPPLTVGRPGSRDSAACAATDLAATVDLIASSAGAAAAVDPRIPRRVARGSSLPSVAADGRRWQGRSRGLVDSAGDGRRESSRQGYAGKQRRARRTRARLRPLPARAVARARRVPRSTSRERPVARRD